jgi:hypothetical protein
LKPVAVVATVEEEAVVEMVATVEVVVVVEVVVGEALPTAAAQ